MSFINRTSNRKNNQSGFAKRIIIIIVVVLLVVVGLGYVAYAKNSNLWPFSQTMPTAAAAKPSVEISKLAVENDTLQVGLKLNNVTDTGHCVLRLYNKTTQLVIDDSKTQRSEEMQAFFKDCEGWGVGMKDFPAGEYTAEVKYVGASQQLSTTKKVTIE